ncbi:MAG: hypothetical protein Ct9H300mP14_03600 [Gammaproteobacteria bacterium]|nr:MAG: hypothetical protein Ct9H300mP14_03600 [Gammaproteobacteria bacterium]
MDSWFHGDGPCPEHRATPQEQVRHVFLSGKPDGFRSFLASAWIVKELFLRRPNYTRSMIYG